MHGFPWEGEVEKNLLDKLPLTLSPLEIGGPIVHSKEQLSSTQS